MADEKLDASGNWLQGYIDPADVISTATQMGLMTAPPAATGVVALAGKATQLPGIKQGLQWMSDKISHIEGAGAGAGLYAKQHPIGSPGSFDIPALLHSAEAGYKREASYQEIFPGLAGVALDMFAPVTALAGSAADVLSVTLRAGIGVAAGQAGKGVSALERNSTTINDVMNAGRDIRANFSQRYNMKRMLENSTYPDAGQAGLDIVSEHLGELHKLRTMKAPEAQKAIEQILPDVGAREELYLAVEDGKMGDLTPAQMQAYPYAQQLRDVLEKRKIEIGSLSQERATGLETKINPNVDRLQSASGTGVFYHGTKGGTSKATELLPQGNSPRAIYVTSSPLGARGYVGGSGTVHQMIIDPKAKIASWEKVNELSLEYPDIPMDEFVIKAGYDGIGTKNPDGSHTTIAVMNPDVIKEVSAIHNVGYVPHIGAPKQEQLKALDAAIKNAAPEDVQWMSKMRADISKGSAAEGADIAHNIRRPGYTKERGMTKTLREMDPNVRKMFRTDTAEALGIEHQQVGRTIEDQKFLNKWIDGPLKGIGISEEKAALKSEPYSELKYPGIPKGIFVPKRLHDEIMGMTRRVADPAEGLLAADNIAGKLYDRGLRWWRNYNLFASLHYPIMNLTGNIFNNYVRHGMGIDSAPDYMWAEEFYKKAHLGKLEAGKPGPIPGLDEVQSWDYLNTHRAVNSGWSHEPGYLHMRDTRTTAQKAKGILGAESPLLEPGKQFSQAVEDISRLAAFKYQLRHGIEPRAAIRGVFSSLFDYENGLTHFERVAVRRIFPFYAWPRFNIPLQLEMMAKNPSRYVNMARLGRAAEMAMGTDKANEKDQAPFLKDNMHINLPGDEGVGSYKSFPLQGVVPATELGNFNNFDNALQYILGSMGPIGVAAQAVTNKDFRNFTTQSAPNLEKIPGEKEPFLGGMVRKRAGVVLKSIGPLRTANTMMTEINKHKEGNTGLRVLGRTALGPTYEMNPAKSAQIAQGRVYSQLKELVKYIHAQEYIIHDPNEKDQAKKKVAAENIRMAKEMYNQIQQQAQQK